MTACGITVRSVYHKLHPANQNTRAAAVGERTVNQEWTDLSAIMHAFYPFADIAATGEHVQGRFATIGAIPRLGRTGTQAAAGDNAVTVATRESNRQLKFLPQSGKLGNGTS